MSCIRPADSPLLGWAQGDADSFSYPDDQAGRRKVVMTITALQQGHLKTGLGRRGCGSIITKSRRTKGLPPLKQTSESNYEVS